MNLATLAWRNLWRHKRRTLITASSIAFGVLLAVTFTGAADYFYTRMIDAGANMGMGHITLAAPDFNRAPSSKKYLHDADQLMQQAKQLSEITKTVPRIQSQAMFASARKSVGGLFIAVDPAIEKQNDNVFLQAIVEGELPQASDERGIVLGIELARKLGVKLGKKVIYTTTDKNGEIVSDIGRVSGLFHTGADELDGALAILPLAKAQQVLGYQPDEVNLIALTLNDQRHSVEMQQRLQKMPVFENAEVLNWQQTQPDLAGMIAVDKSGNYISQLLIALLVAAGILNTMLMSVLERVREFGVMIALGMSPYRLFMMVILESFWLAWLGLIIGTIVTIPWYWYMYTTGIDLSGAYGEGFSFGGVLIDTTFKLRLFGESVVAILLVLFGLAMLSGAYPAWRAGRVPAVESLKTI
jgi:ABC-type lipoprotein release transport system permease subunit